MMAIPKAISAALWERAKGLCEDCRGPGDWRGLMRHHVKLKGMGGRRGEAKKRADHLDNLVLVCGRCHSARHGIREIDADSTS